jgi:flagellar assembly factor FliW
MQIVTTRFGILEIAAEDLIRFPAGLLGIEECREWVLLADAHNDALAWLQSATRPEMAFAVVSPRRFVPGYQLRVSRADLSPLDLSHPGDAHVLVIVGKNERGMTLNLKAPLVIHLERRLGRQVVSNSDLPLQHELAEVPLALRKTA